MAYVEYHLHCLTERYDLLTQNNVRWSGSTEIETYEYSESVWANQRRGWKATDNFISGQYIQVDFGSVHQVDEIVLGLISDNNYVESFQLWYSMAEGEHGSFFEVLTPSGSRTFDGVSSAIVEQSHLLNPPVFARLLRLFPTEVQLGIHLKWKVYGCRAGS